MDDFFMRRMNDLARQAERGGRFTFSGFLTEAEFAQFCAIEKQLPPCGWKAFGGYENAERKMLRFGDPQQLGYEEAFPILCVHFAPAQEKFAEQITHRDVLGAVMHLGIVRSEIGDIRIEHRHAYLFCHSTMADFICGLDRIRRTTFRCEVTDALPETALPQTETHTLQVPSLRLDAVIAKLWHISRSDCTGLFRAGRVFLRGAVIENSSYQLREGDRISVRGYGKFCFLGTAGTTRKGNLIIETEVFV